MTKKELREIEKQIGYQFDNKMLLQQAFIRKSYSQEHPESEDNEVLEFIGDKALDIAVMKTLIEYYGEFTEEEEFISKRTEGKLTEIKKRLVKSKMLASRTELFGFQKYLIMGNGDIKQNVAEDTHVKEDLFEAIVGAVTLDCNWDLEIIQEVVGLMLDIDHYIQNSFTEDNNYVALVQQWHQKEFGKAPNYRFKFTWDYYHCTVNVDGYKFSGDGMTKNEARMEAAKQVYRYLEDSGRMYSMADEIDEPSLDNAINQLQELAQKEYFSMPEYLFEEQLDVHNNTFWTCTCSIEEYDICFRETAPLKKEAKKASAYSMLLYVLEQDEK
ncbi:MAG: hypothetical protein J1F68_01035 [Clostridiales bacterium]|nr:hypothetical protein [Clostridiales bacterium]